MAQHKCNICGYYTYDKMAYARHLRDCTVEDANYKPPRKGKTTARRMDTFRNQYNPKKGR